MNHTPGPWLIHDKDPRDVRELNGKRFVANCRDSQDYRTHEEACANALLIASAPDMLEALQAVMDYWEHNPGNLRVREQAVALVGRAIAKATGS